MANNQLLASDNFQRVGPGLGANWTAVFGQSTAQIVSNEIQPTALSTNGGQVFSGTVWTTDHATEVTLGPSFVNEANTFVSLIVRVQAGSYSGYQVNICDGLAGRVGIYRIDSGVSTLLGTQVTGLTIAAGDVWTFQAAGAVLSLYQNGNRVAYRADATYTSGSAGFIVFSSVNVTHAQVSSWRGYSGVQQDGIWQKQGVVLPLIASDIASSGFGLFQPSVINDNGTYKMWVSGGGTTANIYIATSPDGINWTRQGSPVLSGFANGVVLKNSGTYYMFCQASASQGSGNIALYTSSDGLSWTQQSANVLAPGTSGQWDNAFFYMLNAPVLFNGTWYMFYQGTVSGGANGAFKMGVATASSLTGAWTKYAGNPVLSNAQPACSPFQVGNLWYMWLTVGPSAPQKNTGNFNADPTESVRFQSSDLLNWTNPVRSMHHSQLFESVNTPTGQFAPCSIVNVNGKAYVYSISSPSDGVAGVEDYQVGLAVAPAPISSIVLFPEDAVSQVASDTFVRGAGGLGANWTTPTGTSALQIISSGVVESGTINVDNMGVYTGASFSNDQYSEVTIKALPVTGNFIIPAVRCSTSAETAYFGEIGGPTGSLNAAAIIVKKVAGVQTTLGPFVGMTPNIGDVIRLVVIGNVISLYQNGSLIEQVVDLNPIASGNPGVLLFTPSTLSNAQISSWAGGNANVIPTYPSLIGWLNRHRHFVNKR